MTLHLSRAWQYDEYFVAEESSARRDRYPSVYLDTSIGSYLTARLRRDLTMARKQRLTRIWWQRYRDKHTLFVSERVISEARKGDAAASEARLDALVGIRVLALGYASEASHSRAHRRAATSVESRGGRRTYRYRCDE